VRLLLDRAVSTWIDRLFLGVADDQRRLVDRYTAKLLDVARHKLPERFRGRVDPEDVVQSVYRSFFARVRDGEFSFDDSHDLWRLLIVMTLHKVDNTIKFHLRDRRDVRREETVAGSETSPPRQIAPGPEDVVILCDLLEKLLEELPPPYRVMVGLRLEGHSIEEIASRVAYSRRTVLRVLGKVRSSACKRLGVEP
jgi:RNA polymerase sigma-70 factor (ECF subfamily)